MKRKVRLLVIDSDPKALELSRQCLLQQGYEVLVAANGTLGLKTAYEQVPDLVLIDTSLPDMGWNELGRRLRSNAATEKISIAVLSRQGSAGTGGNEGTYADEFLTKPLDDDEVRTKLLPLLREKAKALRTVVSTGSGELDSKMGGGVPLGSLTLIEGHSGAGKSVLVQQMMWGSLYDGFDLALFTSENTVGSLVRQMHSLSLDILDFVLLNRFSIYHMEVAHLGMQAPDILLRSMSQESERDMLFVDSATSAVAHCPEGEVLSFFESCKRLCDGETTIVIVLHSHSVSQDLLIRLRSLCDAHLQLRTEEVGDRLVRTMEVTKIRGANRTTGNIVSFDVEPGWGMRVIPISKVRG